MTVCPVLISGQEVYIVQYNFKTNYKLKKRYVYMSSLNSSILKSHRRKMIWKLNNDYSIDGYFLFTNLSNLKSHLYLYMLRYPDRQVRI